MTPGSRRRNVCGACCWRFAQGRSFRTPLRQAKEQWPRPARAGDVPRHGGQTLEWATFVFKLAGGRNRDLVLPLAPFAQQHRARREIELTRLGTLLDLRM